MAEPTETNTALLRSPLGNALVAGAAGGLLTLVDPAKLRPSVRGSLYVGTAATAGLLGWFGTAPGDAARPGKPFRAAVAVGLGTLSAAGTKLGFVIDGKIHQALLRQGVENPRPLMAIGAAVITAAMALAEPPRERDVPPAPEDPDVETPERPRP
ncbi:hypothetical protein ACIPVK_00240 [Paeniglutamicibacter sp. MACA_103]|uniref:hypothetical protein n=1 Tax=Paeniglutamicibacter sp. MACA_103 TaxID=3377337 RepID=UPI0038968192